MHLGRLELRLYAGEQLINVLGSNFGAPSATAFLGNLVAAASAESAEQSPAELIDGVAMDSTLAQLDAQSDINLRASNQAAVADGALQAISGLLTDAKSLAVASAGNTLSDDERQANQTQFDSILDSIDRLSSNTTFDGQNLPRRQRHDFVG